MFCTTYYLTSVELKKRIIWNAQTKLNCLTGSSPDITTTQDCAAAVAAAGSPVIGFQLLWVSEAGRQINADASQSGTEYDWGCCTSGSQRRVVCWNVSCAVHINGLFLLDKRATGPIIAGRQSCDMRCNAWYIFGGQGSRAIPKLNRSCLSSFWCCSSFHLLFVLYLLLCLRFLSFELSPSSFFFSRDTLGRTVDLDSTRICYPHKLSSADGSYCFHNHHELQPTHPPELSLLLLLVSA